MNINLLDFSIIFTTIIAILICAVIIFTFVILFRKLGMKYRRFKDFLDKDE